MPRTWETLLDYRQIQDAESAVDALASLIPTPAIICTYSTQLFAGAVRGGATSYLEALSAGESCNDNITSPFQGRLPSSVTNPRAEEPVQQVGSNVQVRGVRNQFRHSYERKTTSGN